MRFSIQTFTLLVALAACSVEAVPHRDHWHDDRQTTTRTVTKTVGKKTTTSTKIKWKTETKYRVSTKYIKERPRTITTCPRKDWWHHNKKTVTRTKTLTAPGSKETGTVTQTDKETLTIPGEGTVITATPDATTVTASPITSTVTEEASTVTVSETITSTTVEEAIITVPTTVTEEATAITVPTTITTTATTEEITTVTVPTTITEPASTVTVSTTIASCVPTFTPTQYLRNPSFDEIDGTNQPVGWTVGTTGTSTNVVTGSVSTEYSTTGSTSYKVHCNNANVFTYVLQQTLTLETGRAYTVRFKARSEMASNAPNGLRLIGTVEFGGVSLDAGWYLSGYAIQRGSWAEIKTRPVYVEKGQGENVVVKIMVTGGAAANIAFRTAYVDDVYVELVE